MARPAFKGFQAHAHKGKDMPTSDADDGRCLHKRLLHQTLMTKMLGDPRMHTQGYMCQLQNPEVQP